MPRRTKKRLATILAAIASLIVAIALAWPWPDEPPDVLRVASWNLRDFTGVREGVDLDAIASIIRENGFHVVAIQEVQGDGEGVDLLADRLGGAWATVVSGRAGDGERFGFLYDDDRLDVLESGFVVGGGAFARRPYVGRFVAGGFDVALVTVHLPATDADARRDEARRLARLLDGKPIGGSERDVVVLGDFNTTRRADNSITPFERRGWLAVIDEPTNLGDGDVLDNLVLDPRHTREYLGRRGVVRFDDGRDDSRLRRTISDHRPIWADFDTTGADDD